MHDESSYLCPTCGEEIVLPLDPSAGAVQDFVEDCPVCCRPNRVRVEIAEDGTASAWAESEAG
jgi:hypothetical protein